MLTKFTRKLSIFLLAAMATSASAGLYKWYDKDGQVHYTDKPPVDAKTESVDPKTSISKPVEQKTFTLEKENEAFEKRREEQLKKEAEEKKKAEMEAKRKQNCISLRKNLQLYLTRNRVAEQKDGQTVVIPYEERVKKIAETEKRLNKECKDY